jgi:hypothetical protein
MKSKVDPQGKPVRNSLSDDNNNTISTSHTDFYNSVQVDDESLQESVVVNNKKDESPTAPHLETKTIKQNDAVDQIKAASLSLLVIR